MKVVIVGGGISGLVLYLFLKKHLPSSLSANESLDIIIYEKHYAEQTSGGIIIGGFLAIAPNGLKAVRDLSEDLYNEILSRGHEQGSFHLKNAKGWNLGQFSAESYDDPPLRSVVIGRQRLWECIRERIPDDAVDYTPIHSVSFPTNSTATFLVGNDSSPQTADLIIGADGVHSTLRSSVTDASDSNAYPAKYVGLVGIGGLLASNIKVPKPGPKDVMTMTFGPNGFFGYGPTSGGEYGWWSTYSMPTPPSSNKAIDPEDVKAQLRSRHKGWKDPNIQTFIANVEINSIYPTWVVPTLPTWSRSNVVLVGDAAHAMQPSSGQGVSQALEDCHVLAIFLAHYLSHPDPTPTPATPKTPDKQPPIAHALHQYEALRKPRAQKCVDKGNQQGDMKRQLGKVEELMMYAFIWGMAHWPRNRWAEWLYGELPGDEARGVVAREMATQQQSEKTNGKK